ncbi:MAG: FAD-linked oxidase C-terminal domain-containing protein [Anaerolineae bacterium]
MLHARETEGVDLQDHPTLFMEFHAALEALEAGLDAVREICKEMGAIGVRATTDTAERRKLWHARRLLRSWCVPAPGYHFFIMDVAVPISAYPELIGYVESLKKEHGVTAYMIGHAGDGNIHVEFPYADDAEFERALKLDALIVHRAIDLGGTATGEHGVGIGKAMFMEHEHGDALDVMRGIGACSTRTAS